MSTYTLEIKVTFPESKNCYECPCRQSGFHRGLNICNNKVYADIEKMMANCPLKEVKDE